MLALRGIVRDAVIAATVAIGDGAHDIVYVAVSPGNYDPATDSINETVSLTPMTVPKVRVHEDSPDYKRNVRFQAKFILPEFEVIAGTPYIPKESDRINEGSSVYTISKVVKLPGAYIVTAETTG